MAGDNLLLWHADRKEYYWSSCLGNEVDTTLHLIFGSNEPHRRRVGQNFETWIPFSQGRASCSCRTNECYRKPLFCCPRDKAGCQIASRNDRQPPAAQPSQAA